MQDSDRLVLAGLSRVHGALSAASAAGEGRGHARRRDHDELPDQLERIDELLTRTTGHVACMPHRHIVPDALFAKLAADPTVAAATDPDGFMPAARGWIPVSSRMQRSTGMYVAFSRPGNHRITVRNNVRDDAEARQAQGKGQVTQA